MDDQQQYAKDAVTLIIELLQNTVADQITTWFEGAPQSMPPSSAFPFCSVFKTIGAVDLGATTTDDFEEEIMIVIMADRSIYAGGPSAIDTPMRHLQRLVEGRDPSQPTYFGQFLPNTILGALRTHLTLGTYAISSKMSIHYDSLPRPNMPAIAECDIKLTLTERVHVTNRN